MLLDLLFSIFIVMMFTVFPFTVTLIISLRIIKKKAQTNYEKPQTELEEILGF